MKKLVLTAAFTLIGLGAASAQTTTPQSTSNQAAPAKQNTQANSGSGVTTATEVPGKEASAAKVADTSKVTTAVDDTTVTASLDQNADATKPKDKTVKSKSKSKKSK